MVEYLRTGTWVVGWGVFGGTMEVGGGFRQVEWETRW